MKPLRLLPLPLALGLAFLGGAAQAQSLQALYESARAQDAA